MDPFPLQFPQWVPCGLSPGKGDEDGSRVCKAREVQEFPEAAGDAVHCSMRVWVWIIQSWAGCWSQQTPCREAQGLLSNHCLLHAPKRLVRLSIKKLWTPHPFKWLTNMSGYMAKQIFICWQSLVNQESRALSTEIQNIQGEISSPH